MKIQYASDLHLEFADNWSYLKRNPLRVSGDILILARDIGYLNDDNYSTHPFWDWVSENYNQVIVVLGNHEFYKFYDISTLEDGLCGEIRHNVHYYYNAVIRVENVDIIVSTLWAQIDLADAYYTENYISDFRRIMCQDRTITFAEFNKEHRRCLLGFWLLLFIFFKTNSAPNKMLNGIDNIIDKFAYSGISQQDAMEELMFMRYGGGVKQIVENDLSAYFNSLSKLNDLNTALDNIIQNIDDGKLDP